MITLVDALISGWPTAEWSIRGTIVEYNSLVWKSIEIQQPTEEEIQAKIQELQAEYDANEYQRKRAAAYPSWQDQLDKIYHEGIDAWKAEIQAIKDQYPKPDGA